MADKEYIERGALKDRIDAVDWHSINKDGKLIWGAPSEKKAIYKVTDVYDAIDKVPTADVVEVRRGEWYRHDKKKHGDTCYYCSVCERMAMTDGYMWELTDFCAYCGADMRGNKDDRRKEN